MRRRLSQFSFRETDSWRAASRTEGKKERRKRRSYFRVV